MAQNNGVEIIKGHMATNSDSDSSFVVIKAHNCGEAVLCTLYKCMSRPKCFTNKTNQN